MNRTKLKALVHYVVAKSDPGRLGAIRLNKILWYADTLAYRASGQSITGETYIKRQHGPVPSHVLTILGELEHEDAIVIRKRDKFGYQMTEIIAVTDPDTSSLSDQDTAIVEAMRGVICGQFTAAEISEASHDQIWDAANIGEVIPLSASLAAFPGEVGDDVLTWADSAIGRFEQVAIAA